MGKGHRDNYEARKKRGPEAFDKKKKRRKKQGKKRFGSWQVDFRCGATEYILDASSSNIRQVAKSQHHCSLKGCEPVKFHPPPKPPRRR